MSSSFCPSKFDLYHHSGNLINTFGTKFQLKAMITSSNSLQDFPVQQKAAVNQPMPYYDSINIQVQPSDYSAPPIDPPPPLTAVSSIRSHKKVSKYLKEVDLTEI